MVGIVEGLAFALLLAVDVYSYGKYKESQRELHRTAHEIHKEDLGKIHTNVNETKAMVAALKGGRETSVWVSEARGQPAAAQTVLLQPPAHAGEGEVTQVHARTEVEKRFEPSESEKETRGEKRFEVLETAAPDKRVDELMTESQIHAARIAAAEREIGDLRDALGKLDKLDEIERRLGELSPAEERLRKLEDELAEVKRSSEKLDDILSSIDSLVEKQAMGRGPSHSEYEERFTEISQKITELSDRQEERMSGMAGVREWGGKLDELAEKIGSLDEKSSEALAEAGKAGKAIEEHIDEAQQMQGDLDKRLSAIEEGIGKALKVIEKGEKPSKGKDEKQDRKLQELAEKLHKIELDLASRKGEADVMKREVEEKITSVTEKTLEKTTAETGKAIEKAKREARKAARKTVAQKVRARTKQIGEEARKIARKTAVKIAVGARAASAAGGGRGNAKRKPSAKTGVSKTRVSRTSATNVVKQGEPTKTLVTVQTLGAPAGETIETTVEKTVKKGGRAASITLRKTAATGRKKAARRKAKTSIIKSVVKAAKKVLRPNVRKSKTAGKAKPAKTSKKTRKTSSTTTTRTVKTAGGGEGAQTLVTVETTSPAEVVEINKGN